MKARPILFSGPMVRALREGYKTQTRRAVNKKWLPIVEECLAANGKWVWHILDYDLTTPYGQPGDLLWVRETIERAQDWGGLGYPADGTWLPNTAWLWKRNTIPSIHMPRWASRITLLIANVRVERLHDISPQDAVAEGITVSLPYDDMHRFYNGIGGDPIAAYRKLWEEINGTGSWAANPLVWVVDFSVNLLNVDEYLRQRRAA